MNRPFAKDPSDRNPSAKQLIVRTARKIFALALTSAALLGTFATIEAAAFTPTMSPCTGKVTVPVTYGLSTSSWINDQMGMPLMPITTHEIDYPARTVGRAVCDSGNQVVKVTYRMWASLNNAQFRSNSQWFVVDTLPFQITLAPGQSMQIPFIPRATSTAYPNLAVDVYVQWLTPTGRTLGTIYINYNATGDYACLTIACQILTDPAVGAYLHLS